MPFDSAGLYTPPNGSENAFPGQIIASATWNAIFTDIAAAINSLAQQGGFVAPRIVTSGGVTVSATDTFIALNKAAPAATAVTLPSVLVRQPSVALRLADFAGNAGDITFTPAGGQTIMGLGTWVLGSAGGAGFGGSITLFPSATLLGWLVVA